MPRSATTRTSAPGRSPPTFRTARAAEGKTRIGSNVRTGVDNSFVAPLEVGDDAWIAPGSVITDDVPPGSLAGFAPPQVTKEGWVYEKPGSPTATELALPGLERGIVTDRRRVTGSSADRRSG